MKIYLAGPYTKGDVGQNVHNAIKTADKLVEKGHTPYIPHLTHFWHLVSPKPWEFWCNLDAEFLVLCDALLRIPGESTGADREVKLAQKHGLPVYYNVNDIP